MMNNPIVIEWFHLEIDGSTCDRCSDTGIAVNKIVEQMKQECRMTDDEIVLHEIRLESDEIRLSNLIKINGSPIENILQQASASKNSCGSCSDLTGEEESCLTLEYSCNTHELV